MKKQTLLVFLLAAVPMSAYSFDQSSPPDSLVVDSSGNVGIGTSSPESNLQVIDASPTVAVRNVVNLVIMVQWVLN